MVKRTTVMILLALCIVVFAPLQASQAQGMELLTNPSFESYYSAPQGQVPTGWTMVVNAPVSSSGHTWPGESRSGASWKIAATKVVFTMVGYQFVPGVRAGSKLRFSAWANLFTCNRDTSCIENGRSYRVSDQSSGARTRIGADPKGGTDPNAPSVIWSDFIAPFDVFQQQIIDFDSQNDNGVTVFLYATQQVGMLLNHVYWDDASLQLLQEGQAAKPTAQYAPMVKPQGMQPDGSIIHVVQPGDTLSSIAYAYKVTVQQIRDLNHLDPDFMWLQIGQKLLIKPPDKSLAATGAATGEATGAATGESASLSTMAATSAATATFGSVVPNPTEGPTATMPPSPTALPTTPLPTVVPISKETSVCVTAFDDANANHWQDTGEKLLPGMALNLAQNNQPVKTLTSTADGPSCFTGMPAGTYVIAAAPPANYGLTTSGQLEIEVKPGAQLALTFGAASGYKSTPATVPISELPPPSAVTQQDRFASILDAVFRNSGLIVFGLAGLVLVGGLGLMLVIRRR